MRFDIYHQFSPEWSEHYVQYDLLKSRLKSMARGPDGFPVQSLDDVLQLLDSNISRFNSLLESHLAVLHAQQDAIVRTLGLNPGATDFSWLPHPKERLFVVREYKRLLSELLKAEYFVRVNQEAIDRLVSRFKSLIPASQSESDAIFRRIRSRWDHLRDSQGLKVNLTRDSFLHFITPLKCENSGPYESLGREAEESETTIVPHLDHDRKASNSWVLELVVRDLPDTTFHVKSVFSTLEEGDVGRISDLFAQLSVRADDTLSRRFRLLFVFFVIQRSWSNVFMLLERAASWVSRPLLFGEPLGIGHDTVQLVLTAHLHDLEAAKTGSFATQVSVSDEHVPDTQSALNVFSYLLQLVGPSSAKTLLTAGSSTEPMLHVLAKHGLYTWCREALEKAQDVGGEGSVIDFVFALDSLKLTPLHYAVAHKHPRTVQLFCNSVRSCRDRLQTPSYQKVLAVCLGMAVKHGCLSDVHELLGLVTDVNLRSSYEMTALHVASQRGKIEIISLLLQSGADFNSYLHPRGWTPIFEAAVHGHADVVTYLARSGADLSVLDYLGWTVKELAMYRGLYSIAELLHVAGGNEPPNVCQALSCVPNPTTGELEICSVGGGEDTIVVVHLGSMQVGRHVPAVQLDDCSSDPGGPNESRLLLEIRAAGKTQEIGLPLLGDMTNAPLIFNFPKGTDLRLGFRVVGSRHHCGGVAILDNNKLLLGPQRQGLVKEHTVYLLDKEFSDVVGSIVFTYVISKPFPGLQLPKYRFPDQITGRKEAVLVGHRGFGQNVATRDYLQIGENTIESFLAAVDAGASFVEFDTQVTRDLEPVIYHDFSLSESGTDIPIHDVTVDQYKLTSSAQDVRPALKADEKVVGTLYTGLTRPRSQSLHSGQDIGVSQIRNRLQHTVDFKMKGMKANVRGDYIQQPLATLQDLFFKVPDTVGFNIEIKYPRFHETVDAGMAPIALELNLFVDTILKQVQLHGRDRPIVLSSFTPEVCILLSLKQKAYPVMFITNAGKLPMTDIEKRAKSTQVAVQFAKLWGLAGIVFASELFVVCPRLIGYVKSCGLICGSYGPRNNNPEDAMLQVSAGLDVMIVDRVGLIANTLKGANMLAKESGPP